MRCSPTHSEFNPSITSLRIPWAIPATGKRISLPVEHITFTFKGDKIASMTSDIVPGGGVAGVLAQIGVPLPPM